MAKEKTKQSRISVLLQVGNYAQLRKEAPDTVVARLEPNPLVFWIGIGSVALALVLTFGLLSLGIR